MQPCGLFILPQHGYVAATPDGVVTDSQSKEVGLIEVKCYYSTATQGKKGIGRAYTPLRLKIGENGKILLGIKEKHYYQVQGALNITSKPWCDYVAWIPSGIFIQTIKREQRPWSKEMFPKLKWFFFNCIRPEIASPQHKRGLIIREREVVQVKKRNQPCT